MECEEQEIRGKYQKKFDRHTRYAALGLLAGTLMGVGGIFGGALVQKCNPYESSSSAYTSWNETVRVAGISTSAAGAGLIGLVFGLSLYSLHEASRRDKELAAVKSKNTKVL